MTMHTFKYRGFISFIGSFLLAISYVKLGGLDGKTAFEIVFGYRPLYYIAHRVGFLFVIILLQFYTAEHLLYMLHNSDNLCVRYNSIGRYCVSAIQNAAVNTTVFFLSSAVGVITALALQEQELPRDMLVVVIWGYVLCFVFVLFQIILMIYVNESETFGIMGGGAIAYTFLSCMDLPISSPPWLVRWSVIFAILAAELVFTIHTMKKRWVIHEN